jgi:hypothetical protein
MEQGQDRYLSRVRFYVSLKLRTMKKKFYSIRVTEAESWDEALQNVEKGHFIETDPLSDAILSQNQLFIHDQAVAVNAYTHWLCNASHDFIERAWVNEPMMARHLRDKLNGLIRRHGDYMSIEALGRFTRELDGTNAAILFKYIFENHLNKW